MYIEMELLARERYETRLREAAEMLPPPQLFRTTRTVTIPRPPDTCHSRDYAAGSQINLSLEFSSSDLFDPPDLLPAGRPFLASRPAPWLPPLLASAA